MQKDYIVKIVYDTSGAEQNVTKLEQEVLDLNAALAKNTATLDKLEKENKDYGASLAKLTEQNAKLEQSLKDVTATQKKQQESSDKMKESLNGLASSGGDVLASTNSQAAGFINMGKSVMAATGPIGLLVAAVGALFAAFAKTGKGGKMLSNGISYLGGVFNKVVGDIGSLMVKLVEYIQAPNGAINDLTKAFTKLKDSPLEVLTTIGNAIKDNLISRFEGAVKMMGIASKIVSKVFAGDFKGAIEATNGLGDAFVQTTTGVENASDKIKDAGKAAASYASELDKAGTATVAFENAQKSLGMQLAVSQGELDKLNASLEMQQQIMEDTTLSEKKRDEAQKQTLKLLEEVSKKELEMANLQLSISAQQLAQDRRNNASTTDSATAYKEALNAKQVAELNYNKTAQELSTARRELLAEESEANLDQIIDGWDSAKSVLERQIAESGRSLEDYKALNDKLASEQNKSIKDRLELIDDSTLSEEESIERRIKLNDKLKTMTAKAYKDMEDELKNWAQSNGDALIDQINLNELAIESDKKNLKEKIKVLNLSIDQQNRLLEMVVEKRAADQDLYDAELQLAKEETELTKKKLEDQLELEKEFSDAKKEIMELDLNNLIGMGVEELKAYNENLTAKYTAALENAIQTGEDTTDISQKYADAQEDIERAKQVAIIGIISETVGQASALFAENTIAFKVLASAQALMNTYLAATSAYAAAAKIDPIILAPVMAGLAVASGLANVAKINEIEFADGGSTLAALGGKAFGPSHAQGGIPGSVQGRPIEFEGGEFIVNKKATTNNQSAIETINRFGSNTKFKVTPYELGGMIGFDANASVNSQLDLTRTLTRALSNMPPPVVTVEDINRAGKKVSVIENVASF